MFFCPKVGVVTGTVTLADGSPVAEAVVRIGSQSETTDADGKYNIKDVHHGDHVLVVLLNNRQVASKKIAPKGESLVVDIDDLTTEPEAAGVTHISFRSNRESDGIDGTWNFYVAEFDGEEVTNVRYFDYDQRSKISPDGT